MHATSATGSAGCAVVGLLAHHGAQIDGNLRLRIAQGVEMGRPTECLPGETKPVDEGPSMVGYVPYERLPEDVQQRLGYAKDQK